MTPICAANALQHQTHYKSSKKIILRASERNNLLPKKGRSTILLAQIESHPNRTLTTNHVPYLTPRASGVPFAGHQPRSVGPLRNSDGKGGDVTTTDKSTLRGGPVHPPTSGSKPTSFVPSPVESTRRVYTGGGPRGGYQGYRRCMGRQGGTRGAHVRTQVAFLVVSARIDS